MRKKIQSHWMEMKPPKIPLKSSHLMAWCFSRGKFSKLNTHCGFHFERWINESWTSLKLLIRSGKNLKIVHVQPIFVYKKRARIVAGMNPSHNLSCRFFIFIADSFLKSERGAASYEVTLNYEEISKDTYHSSIWCTCSNDNCVHFNRVASSHR